MALSPAALQRALNKQRQINRHLQAQLRAETMLTQALSRLVHRRQDQNPKHLGHVTRALNLKKRLANRKPTDPPPATPYPVTSQQAA